MSPDSPECVAERAVKVTTVLDDILRCHPAPHLLQS
jgi:hypothetical protein